MAARKIPQALSLASTLATFQQPEAQLWLQTTTVGVRRVAHGALGSKSISLAADTAVSFLAARPAQVSVSHRMVWKSSTSMRISLSRPSASDTSPWLRGSRRMSARAVLPFSCRAAHARAVGACMQEATGQRPITKQ